MSLIYPIWIGTFGFKSDVCIVSASDALAQRWCREIRREFDQNRKLIDFAGAMRTEKWSENLFITKSGVTFLSRGASGQIKGFRPDCLIVDDIEDPREVESEEQRKKLKQTIFKDFFPALKPDGQFVFIGTIDHPLSVLADLLSEDNGWTKRKYQAYKGGVQEAGHELWPSLWPHDRLQQRKKEIGTFAFASQYMNDPISDESAPIKPEMIRYWSSMPEQYSMVIAVDPAYSEEAKADYKVASLVAIDQQMNRYLVSYIRTHANFNEFFNAILNMWVMNRDRITGIGIPNSGTEKSFFKSFLDAAAVRKLYPPVVELKNTFTTASGGTVRAKNQRIIAALQPLFESGKYYINKSHTEARDELLSIGFSRWDDLVDSLAYAEQIITPVFMETKSPEEAKRDRYGMEVSHSRSTDYGYG
jgi:phage terminase large subunit-like protein